MENQFTFTRPLEYEEKSNGDLVISLDISTTEPDLIHDVVTLNFLKSMQRQILNRNMKLDIEHEAFKGINTEEKEISKTKIPAGRMMEPTIHEYKNTSGETHHRLNIKGLINKFRKDYKDIRGNILEKFLDAGSIAFIPTQKREETKDGIEYRYLDDGIILNTALTGNPMNTTAQMREIISKSIDSIEEYQKAKEETPEIMEQLSVKSHSNSKERDTTKSQEVKNMSEEDEKKQKLKEVESEEVEEKPVESEEPEKSEEPESEEVEEKSEEPEKSEDDESEKDEEIKSLKVEIAEMKQKLSKVVRKEQPAKEDKSANFVSDKSLNPLDMIA